MSRPSALAGAREIDLPESQGYAPVIDHVIACREGSATSRIAPESVLDVLKLTLDVQNTLTAQSEDQSLASLSM